MAASLFGTWAKPRWAGSGQVDGGARRAAGAVFWERSAEDRPLPVAGISVCTRTSGGRRGGLQGDRHPPEHSSSVSLLLLLLPPLNVASAESAE